MTLPNELTDLQFTVAAMNPAEARTLLLENGRAFQFALASLANDLDEGNCLHVRVLEAKGILDRCLATLANAKGTSGPTDAEISTVLAQLQAAVQAVQADTANAKPANSGSSQSQASAGAGTKPTKRKVCLC